MERIQRETLNLMMYLGNEFALIEVLDPDEYRRGHLPGAINIPPTELAPHRVLSEVPDKSKPVVVYCESPETPFAPQAASQLEALGYRSVYTYDDGKTDWLRAGLPVEA